MPEWVIELNELVECILHHEDGTTETAMCRLVTRHPMYMGCVSLPEVEQPSDLK